MTTTRELIKKVLDERANTWETTGKPLADIAAEREFTAEEVGLSEKAEEAFRAYDQRLKVLNLTLDQERAVADFSAALNNDHAVRSAFETELRSVLVDKSKKEGVLTFTGRDVNDALLRALAKGTASAGGNLVPTTLWDQLIVPLRNFVSVLSAGATVITTGSGEDMAIPRLASFGNAVQVGEGVTITGTDPTFDQVMLKAFKLGQFLGLSHELVEDSVIDIERLVVDLVGANIGILLGQRTMTGTGSNQTAGLATSATVGVTGANGVGGAPTFDNLIDLYYSVVAPYRVNGSWIVADAALAGLRKIKDTTGQYLWTPSVQLGQPDLILGKAMYGDPNLPTGAASKSVLFGDISKYWVRFVNQLRVERSDQALFGSDQVAFRGLLRADGALVDTSAVKSFLGGTA